MNISRISSRSGLCIKKKSQIAMMNQQKPRREEEEDEEEGVGEDWNEDEDNNVVLLGVPASHHESFDSLSAVLASGIPGISECKCSGSQGGKRIEIFKVSAPFDDIVRRDLRVEICCSCRSLEVTRSQSQSDRNEVAANNADEENDVDSPAQLFTQNDVGASAPTDDDLDALFSSLSTSKPKSNPSQKSKSSSKKKSSTKSSGTFLRILEEPYPLEDQGFSHEEELLARYNKEAQATGEETFDSSTKEATALQEDFFERMGRCPHQCFRYDYGGKPLFPDVKMELKAKPPTCEKCGSSRLFEFQLTPQSLTKIVGLVGKLENGEEFDFSTLIVYSCSKSCSEGNREHCEFFPAI